MPLFIPLALLTLCCLAGLLILRTRFRRAGIPQNEIGRRALATPLGLICFWGTIVGFALTFTALAAWALFP